MIDKFIKINDLKIGYNYEPVIIAEIGINHEGSLDIAKKMAKLAIDSGAKIIKHQTHIVEDEMSVEADKNIIEYIGKSIYQLMKECSLNKYEELELKRYIEDLGSIFISTPFSRAAADRLMEFNVPAFKIGSGECNNYPLIKHICSFRKPIILSTGMNTIDSISKAVAIIESHEIEYALLHTTNIYPTPDHLVRLNGMVELENNFKNAVIGLSDHTITNHACFGAVALGASILERHFTDNMQRVGPDIKNSMDPQATKELVEGSKILFMQRGGSRNPVQEESPVINFAFASVVAINDIKEGEALSKENIWVKRPGTGPFFAKDYDNLIGRIAKRNIKNGTHIKKEDV